MTGQLSKEMLARNRRDGFWATVETEVPDQEYLDETAAWDAAFAADTETYIARFEAGR
jgi:hypothetical protein